MNNPIDSTSIFDSRDLIEYKEYLADELLSTANDTFEDADDFDTVEELQEFLDNLEESEELAEYHEIGEFDEDIEEYTKIEDFCNELDGYGDFSHGESIISEEYFTEYCEELCKDCGYISNDLPSFIESNIDWDGVADDLRVDYMTVDYEGTTYLMRA